MTLTRSPYCHNNGIMGVERLVHSCSRPMRLGTYSLVNSKRQSPNSLGLYLIDDSCLVFASNWPEKMLVLAYLANLELRLANISSKKRAQPLETAKVAPCVLIYGKCSTEYIFPSPFSNYAVLAGARWRWWSECVLLRWSHGLTLLFGPFPPFSENEKKAGPYHHKACSCPIPTIALVPYGLDRPVRQLLGRLHLDRISPSDLRFGAM